MGNRTSGLYLDTAGEDVWEYDAASDAWSRLDVSDPDPEGPAEPVALISHRPTEAEGMVTALRELIHDGRTLEDLLTEELAGHSYEYPVCPKDGLAISMLPDEDPLPRHLADCALSVILPRLKAALGEGSS